MAKALARLLDEPEVLVESAIKKLEHISGWESTDVRLLTEINSKVRAKISDLGLDPDDTTGPELYHALLAKLNSDEQSINISSKELLSAIEKAHQPYKVYALKQSAAKDILRNHPPRKLMKQLNYRSADSMLKRENIIALYAVLTTVESPRWQGVFWKDLAKLTPSDFETRAVSLITIPEKYTSTTGQQVSNLPLLGSIVVWSSQGSRIGLAADITSNISALRSECALIKLRNVEADFGKNLVEIVNAGSDHPLRISHLPVSWHTIFHHYGQRPVSEHTEFFGPHILHEDIKAHEVLKSLAAILPALEWWQELEFVAQKTEESIVSLNLLDMLESQGKEFKERSLSHFRKSLWHEFINRYFAHPSVEQHFMQQLEPQSVPVIEMSSKKNPELEIRQMMELGA
jgi:hypothetical protein